MIDLIKLGKLIKNVDGKLFRKSNAMDWGHYRSAFKGHGLEFSEFRNYVYGDDVRRIDWVSSQKVQRPIIRTFSEERNVKFEVFIDATSTMGYGYEDKSKFHASLEIATFLILLAGKNNDSVNVTLLGAQNLRLPNLKGYKGVSKFIKELGFGSKITAQDILTNNDSRSYDNIRPIKSRCDYSIILSDFSQTFMDRMSSIIPVARKTINVQILSPLDQQVDLPYAINSNGGYGHKISIGNRPNESLEISLANDVLDQFIRGMHLC